jgi:hypothetical protein
MPNQPAGHNHAFREHLGRAARSTFYLRVLFSMFLLIHAGFGPGLLLRFPLTGSIATEPLAQFYAFRPVIYALVLVALVCVLAALCRRAVVLFEAEFAEDTKQAAADGEPERYLRLLRPSPTPFILSGNVAIDLTTFTAALLAYSFWVIILAETAPPDMAGYQVGGIVLGSYGLFAAIIITGLVWFTSWRRLRRLSAAPPQGEAGPGQPSST